MEYIWYVIAALGAGIGTGLERWNVLLICIVVATAASLISAQFANRVKNRTVGLVTGAVLTVLGAAMLILNYWSIISEKFRS